MSLYVFPKEETYHLNKDGCANNTPFSLPISDPKNIWGFIYEDETDLIFDANIQAAFYEAESPYLFQIQVQPLTIFDDFIIAYDTNGRKYLYFRGLKAGVLASPTFCKFLLGFTDNNGDAYTTYPYTPIGDVYGCGCGDEPTVEIESTPQDDYDCCGIYYGKGINVIYASDPDLHAINRTEIYGSLKAAPAQNKVKRFNNCKVKSIDFAKKKRIRYQPVPAEYMNLVDCILSSGNIKVDGVEYLVDANNNFDELEAVCLCMFSQDIRLSECNCVKSFGCDINEGTPTCSIFNVIATQSLTCFNYLGTIINGYTLNWSETGTITNVIITGDLQGSFSVPAGTLTTGILININTPTTITLTSDTTDPLNPLCSTSITITPPDCPMLRMKFVTGSPELSFTLAQWNTAFNLPINGTPFTGIAVVGDNVYLTNGGVSNIDINNYFRFAANNARLLEFDDSLSSYIYSGSTGSFEGCPLLTTLLLPVLQIVNINFAANCPNLSFVDIPTATIIADFAFSGSGVTLGNLNVNMPQVTYLQYACFNGSGIVSVNCPLCTLVNTFALAFCSYLTTVNLPIATAIGDSCFNNDTSLTSVIISSCVNLGIGLGDNQVFGTIYGITATITVPTFLQTCNAGNPDGDLVVFISNNPASTIIYV